MIDKAGATIVMNCGVDDDKDWVLKSLKAKPQKGGDWLPAWLLLLVGFVSHGSKKLGLSTSEANFTE